MFPFNWLIRIHKLRTYCAHPLQHP